MITIITTLVIVLAFITLGWKGFTWVKKRHSVNHQMIKASQERQITDEERQAAEHYLAESDSHTHGAFRFFSRTLIRGKTVYGLTHSITRYGLSSESPQQWRYYLDAVEVDLPPLWEAFITTDNLIELVYTRDKPLIISLNGHSLVNYSAENDANQLQSDPTSASASIRKEQREQVELLNIRKETLEEYQLSHQNGIVEAIVICAALFLFFLSLIIPDRAMLWLALPSIVIAFIATIALYCSPSKNALREIRVMRGTPKRWGLFGESNQEQTNVSLGVIDLQYPDYWQPYIHHDLGQETRVDIDEDNLVVRQGDILSLHKEVTRFPVKSWKKNAILAMGALLLILMTASWVPLAMPFKISLAWLHGIQHVEVSSIDQLSSKKLHVGDLLKVTGEGRCSVPGTYQSNRVYNYLPFDCSAVYWNKNNTPPLPQSTVIQDTEQLLTSIKDQLHPSSGAASNVNPQLASAIQKSGMVLLSNFSEIVLKTNQVCHQDSDCPRLKNALVNLENAKDWSALTQKASSGALKGINVLLRPTSAQNLESLVNEATASFITQETRRAIQSLQKHPHGGFLIKSDEGRQFVDQEQPDIPLFELAPALQWSELQSISKKLLKTPFSVSGIITSLHTDSHGTTLITVHDEPNNSALWNYLFTALFFVTLIVLLAVNGVLAIRRLHADYQRSIQIKQYYEDRFNAR